MRHTERHMAEVEQIIRDLGFTGEKAEAVREAERHTTAYKVAELADAADHLVDVFMSMPPNVRSLATALAKVRR